MSRAKARPPRDWREERRLRAWALHQQGWIGKTIAEALGVPRGTVSRWLKRAREGDAAALYRQPPPGPTPRLSAEQLARLPGMLAQGAEAFGFLDAVWTSKRVAAIIREEFGIRYHPDYIGRLLRAVGWSAQKPIRRPTQRDEAAIEQWSTERWPALQAKPRRRGALSFGSTSRLSIPCLRWSARGHLEPAEAGRTSEPMLRRRGRAPVRTPLGRCPPSPQVQRHTSMHRPIRLRRVAAQNAAGLN